MRARGMSAWAGVGSLVVVVALLLCVRLGWWQWERAQVTGGARNYVYAVEWWLFGLLGTTGWVKILRDERRAPAEPVPDPDAADRAAAVATVDDSDLDDETRAYNAFLAQLAANPRR